MRLVENWNDQTNNNKSISKDLFMLADDGLQGNYIKNRIGSTESALKSFSLKDKLNDKVWDGEKIKPEIRKGLLDIAYDFMDELKLKEEHIEDVIFTGSLANVNWSEYSDFDLHIIIDFKKIADNVKIVKDYFDTKKNKWNEDRDVELHDYPVEIYVQEKNETNYSTGIFSLLHNKWLIKPKEKGHHIDEQSVKTKATHLMSTIKKILKIQDPAMALEKIDAFKNKIRRLRASGLSVGGEFSTENLAFKVLRRNGYIQKLNKFKNKMYNKKFSI